MLMADFTPAREDHVSGEEFVKLARAVLADRQTENFSDDWVAIRSNHNGLDLEITRQKQPGLAEGDRNAHLRVENPVTMVMRGEVIRHHGEHCYLTAHLRSLLAVSEVVRILDNFAEMKVDLVPLEGNLPEGKKPSGGTSYAAAIKVISYDEAREQGMIAYERGDDANSNPYKSGHTRFGWDDGFDYAKFMTETE